MRFIYKDKEYLIRFRYLKHESKAKKNGEDYFYSNRSVYCFIHSHGTILCEGTTVCDSRDQFTVEDGRVQALKAAIENFFENNPEEDYVDVGPSFKKLVWDAYRSRKPKKKKKIENPKDGND